MEIQNRLMVTRGWEWMMKKGMEKSRSVGKEITVRRNKF